MRISMRMLSFTHQFPTRASVHMNSETFIDTKIIPRKRSFPYTYKFTQNINVYVNSRMNLHTNSHMNLHTNPHMNLHVNLPPILPTLATFPPSTMRALTRLAAGPPVLSKKKWNGESSLSSSASVGDL